MRNGGWYINKLIKFTLIAKKLDVKNAKNSLVEAFLRFSHSLQHSCL